MAVFPRKHLPHTAIVLSRKQKPSTHADPTFDLAQLSCPIAENRRIALVRSEPESLEYNIHCTKDVFAPWHVAGTELRSCSKITCETAAELTPVIE